MRAWSEPITFGTKSPSSVGTSTTSFSRMWPWWCATPTDRSRSIESNSPPHRIFWAVRCTVVGFLAGMVLGAPMTGAAVGAMLGGAGTAASAGVGIGQDFIETVKKPGTSALFGLDSEGEMDMILHAIRGLGGIVLKTNVDVERARLIQSTLAPDSRQPGTPDGQ